MACGTTIYADLGGTTFAPGVYCSASSVGLTRAVTFDGQDHSNATFVIQLNDNASLLCRALARNGALAMGSNNSITLP